MNSRPTAITERACELELPAHRKLAPTAHGGELATVEKAMRLYGPPDNQPGTPDRLRATFARLTGELADAKAPIRRSLEKSWPSHLPKDAEQHG